jgi:hypothetical protein
MIVDRDFGGSVVLSAAGLDFDDAKQRPLPGNQVGRLADGRGTIGARPRCSLCDADRNRRPPLPSFR